MDISVELARGRVAVLSAVRLWLVFLVAAAAAVLLMAAVQHADAALSRLAGATAASAAKPTTLPPVAFAPTFADAAASLRSGRYADAYGRFVALAEEGDVDAARIALLMHRFGPEVFGSEWDASPEQLEAWTAWSETAARRDLARGPGGTGRAAGADSRHGPR